MKNTKQNPTGTTTNNSQRNRNKTTHTNPNLPITFDSSSLFLVLAQGDWPLPANWDTPGTSITVNGRHTGWQRLSQKASRSHIHKREIALWKKCVSCLLQEPRLAQDRVLGLLCCHSTSQSCWSTENIVLQLTWQGRYSLNGAEQWNGTFYWT